MLTGTAKGARDRLWARPCDCCGNDPAECGCDLETVACGSGVSHAGVEETQEATVCRTHDREPS